MDGTTSTSQNPHIKFTAFGTYTIALTATNAIGTNTITKTNYIAVNTVNADFTASPTTIVVGNSTTFTDASTCSISSWAWDFGAGASPATANTQGPHIVTYSTTGLKTVTLTLNGTVIQTKTNFITVTEPIFNMANGTITTCTGNFYDSGGSAGSYQNNENFTETFYPSTPGFMISFNFTSFNTESGYDFLRIYNGTSTSAALIGTYNGTTGPGTVTASNPSGALTFNFTSDASVTPAGWAAAISCQNTSINANFSANNTTTCVSSGLIFSDLTIGSPTSWTWSFPGGTPSSYVGQNPPSINYLAAGTYNVSLEVSDGTNTDTETKIGYILVNPLVADFTGVPATICAGGTVTFTQNSACNPTLWTWSFPGGTPSSYVGQNPPAITYATAGVFDVSLTISNGSSSDTKVKTGYVTVNFMVADFTGAPTSVVIGNTVTFTNNSSCNPAAWNWSFPGGTPSSYSGATPPAITYSILGTYDVTLTITKPGGTDTKTRVGYITVTPPIFNMSNGTITTCTGNFYDSGGSAGSYQNNENFTETFYPSTPGSMVRFIFNSFSTESGYDYLRIYNGTSTSATLIGTYNGTTGPGTVTASNASGALTFNFTSDVSVTSTGWSATISCYNTNVPPVADFSTSGTNPVVNTPVTFTDLSTNLPTSWLWTFSPSTITYLGATSATSQNPQVQFNAAGTYTVSLTATNAYGNNTMVKSGYINAINCTITAFPWLAGFENAGTIPSCWTQEYVTTPGLNWIFVAGNGSVNPATAHTGSYNACLKDNTSADNKTKLVSPPLDLTLTSSPVLKFWHTQAFWSPDQDILSVYYRTTAGGAWTLLTTYSSTITTWTEETITLPSPSATYYIGFEGNAKYGYGVCIDDVSVTGSSKTLNLTVFLEGLFNGTTMNKAQSAAGNQFPGAVADQVTVELHNSTSPYALAGGPYIVDVNTDGTASLTVPASLGASYYIVVKHRNSLETWNGSPVSFGAASMSYNFSSAAEQAFGSNLKLVSGKYVIFGGDVNQDGILDAADMTPMDNDASNFVNGYIATDANGDGIVNAGDVILLQNNASLFVAKIVP
jgi:PKD repeat protein